jgi:predicted HAD superfamily Cof-like phosphohydrolase
MSNPFKDQAQFMLACGQTVGEVNHEQALLYRKLIDEEYKEFTTASSPFNEADAVIDLIVVLIGYAHSRGWPLAALWDEVHASNMAKIDPATGQVRRREDGKILKPDGWTPPDIGRHLNAG